MGGVFVVTIAMWPVSFRARPQSLQKFPKNELSTLAYEYLLGSLVSYFVPPSFALLFSCFVSPKMLELLLSAGSNINAQNIVGDAPLHKAALNGRALSTDYLLRSGANVNIRSVAYRCSFPLLILVYTNVCVSTSYVLGYYLKYIPVHDSSVPYFL